MASDLKKTLSKTYNGLKLWEIIVIALSAVFFLVIAISIWLTSRKKPKKTSGRVPGFQDPRIPDEIKEIRIDPISSNNVGDRFRDKELKNSKNDDPGSRSGSFNLLNDKVYVESHPVPSPNPLTAHSSSPGLPEVSNVGWGHWFTLRDLQFATNHFSKDNIIGDGGYGVVYRGHLINGSSVAVKKLLNNPGQADKDFRVEVEAIGHVRHKNLVKLLGYCIEGTQRMLVYEYVDNGNLEQWLHGDMSYHGYLTWEARMKILAGTAKALAYLHEAIEPKVVHRDIKSSNILIDSNFNARLSDFGLAKLLGADKSFITTRVMGTYGYVAPEYANSGLLNEKSDVYSFGVVLLEVITGRYPVDYGRPQTEVHMVEWLKTMVQLQRFEDVVDPNVEAKLSTSGLKRALLTALRCVDLDAEKRPKMSQVARLLESEEHPFPTEDRRQRRNRTEEKDGEPHRENTDIDSGK